MANMGMGQYKRPWRARLNVQNGESSASFAAGNAAILLASDMSKVVRSPTAGAAQSGSLFAGIAVNAAAPGQFLDIIVGGHAPSVGVQLMTRAATTDGWASYPAIAVGDYMTVETVNGLVARSAAGAAAAFVHAIVALGTVASATTQASTTSNSATVSSTTIACLIRALV